MNITVIGTGYVGLVTGACFAELGNHVTCVDINKEKIANLRQGILPIYEPGLENIVNSNIEEGRLHFYSSLQEVTEKPEVIFIAVGTPSDENGAADIRYVLSAAKDIGEYITDYCVIVDKSTVPVGMADQVTDVIKAALSARQLKINFDVVSNPEFLREGAAIEDFMRPDRVVIGLDSNNARRIMLDLYLPILRSPEKIYFMQVKDAEMTKYAANAMLATRISFMNEMAVLCEKLGVDIENVRIGIGSDTRIGSAFLNAGCGYGGSCFPKDVRALMKMAEQHNLEPHLLKAVENRNYQQKLIINEKITQRFGKDLSGLTFGIWGLAFKPGTDDMREAASLVLIENLINQGATIQAYDPAAMDVTKKIIPAQWLKTKSLTFAQHQYDALNNVDALVLVTEWKPFCYPDIGAMQKLMRQKVIFDGRNQYDPQQMLAAGFEYQGIGRGYFNTEKKLETA